MSELKQALENLKSFSQLLDKSPLSSNNSILNLSYRIGGLFSSRNRLTLIDQVCQSSDIVKSYSSLIHLLEEGDQEQQKFARDVKEIVERFNSTVDRVNKKPTGWGDRIARFLYSRGGMFIGEHLAKIELPRRASVQINFPFPETNSTHSSKCNYQWQQQGTSSFCQKISDLCHSRIPVNQPPAQTLELYLMKVISLLVKSQLLLQSEAREIVRETSCQISIDKEKQVLAISQVLEPIPGQIIKVSGAFKKDSGSSLYTIFLPEACEFSTESVQTGFPHALQRNGWALTEDLIPFSFATEKSTPYSHLHALKNKIAQELLPKGKLTSKARQLIRIKKLAFENQRTNFLSLHKQLVLAVARKIGEPISIDVVNQLFAHLKDLPNVYEQLSGIHQQIIQSCIKDPQKGLLQAHAARKIEGSSLKFDPETILLNAHEQSLRKITSQQSEKSVAEYMQMMSGLLFLPSKQLILQNYSDIDSTKVTLPGKAAEAMQKIASRQLEDFYHELTVSNLGDMSMRMQTLLEADIASFV